MYDPEEIQEEAVSYFQKLYGDPPSNQGDFPSTQFSQLEQSDIEMLKKEVKNGEIKQAFFDMASLKALGIDGIHALFFKNQWDNM